MQRELNPPLPLLAARFGRFHQFHEPLDFVRRGGPPIRVRREASQNLARLFAVRLARVARQQPPLRRGARVERPFQFQIFHEQRRGRFPLRRFDERHRDPLHARHSRDRHLDHFGRLLAVGFHFRRRQPDARPHCVSGERFDRVFLFLRLRFRPDRQQRNPHGLFVRMLRVHADAETVFGVFVHVVRRVQRADVPNLFLLGRGNRAKAALRHVAAGRLQIPRGLATHRWLRWFDHDRALHDRFRGRQISLHQHGRKGQHIADVVEAVTDVVRRKIFRRQKIHADQIANRVVVFRPIQPPHRDVARVRLGVAVRSFEHRLDRLQKRRHFLARRPRPFLGRHLAQFHHVHHRLPLLARLQHGRFVAKRVQRQVRLRLLFAMTMHAMLLHKPGVVLQKVRRWLGRFIRPRVPGKHHQRPGAHPAENTDRPRSEMTRQDSTA